MTLIVVPTILVPHTIGSVFLGLVADKSVAVPASLKNCDCGIDGTNKEQVHKYPFECLLHILYHKLIFKSKFFGHISNHIFL